MSITAYAPAIHGIRDDGARGRPWLPPLLLSAWLGAHVRSHDRAGRAACWAIAYLVDAAMRRHCADIANRGIA